MASNYVQLNWLEPAWDDDQFGALSSLERRQRKAAEKQDVHAFYSSLKFVFFIIAAVLVWSEANAIMTDASRALTGAFVLEVWKSAGVAYAQLQLLYKQVGELAWIWNAVVYGHDFAQRGLSITHGVAKLLAKGLLYLAVFLSVMLVYITLPRLGHAPLRTATLSTLATGFLFGAPPLYALVIAKLCNGCSPEPAVLLALLFAALMLAASISMSRRITGRMTGEGRAGGGPQTVTQGGGPGGGTRGGNSRSNSTGGPVRRASQGTSTATGGGSGGGGGVGGGAAATTAPSGGGRAGEGAAENTSSYSNKRSTATATQSGRSRGGGTGGTGMAAGDVTAHITASGRSSSTASLTSTTAFSSAMNSGAYASGGGVHGAVFDPAAAASGMPLASSGGRSGGGLMGSSRTASTASSSSSGTYDPTIATKGSGSGGQPSGGSSRHSSGSRTVTSSSSSGSGSVSAVTHGPSSHSLPHSQHSRGAPNQKGVSGGCVAGASSSSSMHASPTLHPLIAVGSTSRGGGGATGGISSSSSQPGSGGGSVSRNSTCNAAGGATSKQQQQQHSRLVAGGGSSGGDGGGPGGKSGGGGCGAAAGGKQSSAQSSGLQPGVSRLSSGPNEPTAWPGSGGGGKASSADFVMQSGCVTSGNTTKSAASYDLVNVGSGPASKRKGGAGGESVAPPPPASSSAVMYQSLSCGGGGVSNGGSSTFTTLSNGGSASVTHRSTGNTAPTSVAGTGGSTTMAVAANGTGRTTRAADATVSKPGGNVANGAKGPGTGGAGSAVPLSTTPSLPSVTATAATATVAAGNSNATTADGGSRPLSTTLTTTAGGSTYTLVGATGSTNAAVVTPTAAASSHSPVSAPRVAKRASGPATSSVVTAVRKTTGATSSPQYLLISPSVPPLAPPPPPPRRSPTTAAVEVAAAPVGEGSPQQPPAAACSPSEAAPVRNAWLKPNPVIKLAVGVAKGPRGATAIATTAAAARPSGTTVTGNQSLVTTAATNAQDTQASGVASVPSMVSALPNTQLPLLPPPLTLPSVHSASYGGATGTIVEPLTVSSCGGGVTPDDPPVLSARSPGSVSSGGTGFLSAVGDPVAPSPPLLSSSSSLSGGVITVAALTQAIGVTHGSLVTPPSSSPSPSPNMVTTSTLSPHAQPYYLPETVHRTAGVTSQLLTATMHSTDQTNQLVPIIAHKHASGDLEIAAVAANYQPYPSTAPVHHAFGSIHTMTSPIGTATAPSGTSCEADAESFSFFSIPPPVILDSALSSDGATAAAIGVSPTETDTLLASASPLSYRGYSCTSGFPFGHDPVWSPNVPSTIFTPPSPTLGGGAAVTTAGRTARVPPPGFPSHAYGGAFAAGPLPGAGVWAPPQPHHPSQHAQPAAMIAPVSGVAAASAAAPAPSRDTLPLPPASESGVLASLGFVEDVADSSSGTGDDAAGGSCAICWSAPRQVGFLHGKTSHLCVCRSCAVHLREGVHRCPMCRQLIERIIDIF